MNDQENDFYDIENEIVFKLCCEMENVIKNKDLILNNKTVSSTEKKIKKYLGPDFIYWVCSTYFEVLVHHKIITLTQNIDPKYYWTKGSERINEKKSLNIDALIESDVNKMFKGKSKFDVVTVKMEKQLKKEIFNLIKRKVFTVKKVKFELIKSQTEPFEEMQKDSAKMQILSRIFNINSKTTFEKNLKKLDSTQASLKIFIYRVVERLESENKAKMLFGNYREAFVKYLLSSLSEEVECGRLVGINVAKV